MNIDRPSCETVIWYLDETCHVIFDCTFFIYFFLVLVLVFHYYYFLLGFSLSCEPKVTRDFAEEAKMAHEGKASFVFGYDVQINFKRRKVICSYTLEIKIPRQVTTLNVKSAARDLFDVFMGINHRKYSSYSLKLCSLLW